MNPDGVVRICLWSGPRNISTALMYSFAQRPDAKVFDEPLYAFYLSRTEAKRYHPGADLVLQSMDADGERVVCEILLGPQDRPVVFFKNMAHHLLDLDRGFLERMQNVILTRDPQEVLISYARNVSSPTLLDTGYAQQVEILEHLQSRGLDPPILDSREVLKNPRGVLSTLCERLGIDFHPEMLSWQPGARPEDGVWAPFWYQNVHQSSGLQPYRPKKQLLPERLEPLWRQCLPYYEKLSEKAIRGDDHQV